MPGLSDPRDSPDTPPECVSDGASGGADVLVQAEHVVRVPDLLQRGEAVVGGGPVGLADAVGALIAVEVVHVAAAGAGDPGRVPHRAGPRGVRRGVLPR